MHEAIGVAVDVGERQVLHELHDPIIRPMDIVQREVPLTVLSSSASESPDEMLAILRVPMKQP